MTLHDELAAASQPSCKLCAFIALLPAAEAEEWRTELALPVQVIGNNAVLTALALRGIKVTEASIRRHRSRHAR